MFDNLTTPAVILKCMLQVIGDNRGDQVVHPLRGATQSQLLP